MVPALDGLVPWISFEIGNKTCNPRMHRAAVCVSQMITEIIAQGGTAFVRFPCHAAHSVGVVLRCQLDCVFIVCKKSPKQKPETLDFTVFF